MPKNYAGFEGCPQDTLADAYLRNMRRGKRLAGEPNSTRHLGDLFMTVTLNPFWDFNEDKA